MLYLKPFAAVLTFIIGTLAAYFLMPLPDIQVVRDDRFHELGVPPETVSVCALASRPERYDGKIVRIEANIEFNNAGSSSLTDNACLNKWVRLACDAGYPSCRGLLEEVRQTEPDEARIVAVGRFFASVLERVPEGVNTRVPLFEITETKGLETKGGIGVHRGVNPCKYEGRRCGYGSGIGDSSGSGSGHGGGYGSGEGRGTGHGTGTGSSDGGGSN
jgi:uncharacterized membrane protein YgcG